MIFIFKDLLILTFHLPLIFPSKYTFEEMYICIVFILKFLMSRYWQRITEMELPLKQRVRFKHTLPFSNNKRGYLADMHMQDFTSEKILELKNAFHTMVFCSTRCFPVAHEMNCILWTLLAWRRAYQVILPSRAALW